MVKISSNFADRLIEAIETKQSVCVVGLDPRIDLLPKPIIQKYLPPGNRTLKSASRAIEKFNQTVIDVIADYAIAVKIQVAFFEMLGGEGFLALEKTIKYARSRGLLVIVDGKRNDIGSTVEAYSSAYFSGIKILDSLFPSPMECDAITVNPYLGTDGISPFLKAVKDQGKGLFVLVKTSNPSSAELQDLSVDGDFLYEKAARLVGRWGHDCLASKGYSSVGAVVGATYPEVAKKIREILPKAFFLVPGYGAQGARAEDLSPFFDENGLGAIVNSARNIIFAYKKADDPEEENFQESIEKAIIAMRDELNEKSRGIIGR